MIYYFKPYSLSKNYFEAIKMHMQNLQPNDWGCIMDGDTMFLNSNYGHILEEYITAFPETGLFTCFTNRCHYPEQRLRNSLLDLPDVTYHKKIADQQYIQFKGKVNELNKRIAGHLMLIKKSVWDLILPEAERMVIMQQKKIMGVDTKISNAILKQGLKIRLMQAVYIFHFCRLDKNIGDNSHIC